MVVRNDLDRFHLVEDVIDRLPQLGGDSAPTSSRSCENLLIEHRQYISTHGDDLPEIKSWAWTA